MYMCMEQCYLAKEGGEFGFVCLFQEYPELAVHSSLLRHSSDMLLQGSPPCSVHMRDAKELPGCAVKHADPCQVVLLRHVRHKPQRAHIPHRVRTELKNSISTALSSLFVVHQTTGNPSPYSSTTSSVSSLKSYALVPCVAATQTTLPSANFLSISAWIGVCRTMRKSSLCSLFCRHRHLEVYSRRQHCHPPFPSSPPPMPQHWWHHHGASDLPPA